MEIDSDNRGQPPERLRKRLARVAFRQHGVVARRQLIAIGFSRDQIDRLVAGGYLHPLHRGVYAVGHVRLTHRGQWMAAVLACGTGAVLSHHAAAALHGLRPRPEALIDVTARGKRSHTGVRCHVGPLDPADCTTVDNIPVTTIERTFIDYAELSLPRQLTAALEAAQRQNVFDLRKLNAAVARNPGRHGLKPLRAAVSRLLPEVPWTQSPPEETLRAIVRDHGLPAPRFNVIVEGELVDAVWDDGKVIVEVDGYGFHRTRRAFADDRRRDRKLRLAGYIVLRYPADEMESDGATVAAEIRRALRRS